MSSIKSVKNNLEIDYVSPSIDNNSKSFKNSSIKSFSDSSLTDNMTYMDFKETNWDDSFLDGNITFEGKYVDDNGKTFDATYYYTSDGVQNVQYKDGIKEITIKLLADGTKISSETKYFSPDGSIIKESISYNIDGTISKAIYEKNGSTIEVNYEYTADGLLDNVNIVENGHDFNDSNYDFGQIIVDLASSQVGQSGEKYWKYLTDIDFLNGDDTPWCACFVSWVTGHVNYNGKNLSDLIGHEGTGVEGFIKDLSTKGMFHRKGENYAPRPGDFVILDDGNWSGDINENREEYMLDHIGIVKEIEPDGTIVTIEGNADNQVKIRKYNQEGNGSGELRIAAYIGWQSN